MPPAQMLQQTPALDARQALAQRVHGVNIQAAAQQPGVRALPVFKRHALRQHLDQTGRPAGEQEQQGALDRRGGDKIQQTPPGMQAARIRQRMAGLDDLHAGAVR